MSIALERAGALAIGVVYDPMRDDLYCAQFGRGATRNSKRILVAPTNVMAHAVVSTGFPYDAWTSKRDNLAELTYMSKHARGVRSSGPAALDLAAVASGTRDAHWESGLSSFDIAAGIVLVQEAGGVATDYAGNQDVLNKSEVMAANPALHALMLDYLRTRHVARSFCG